MPAGDRVARDRPPLAAASRCGNGRWPARSGGRTGTLRLSSVTWAAARGWRRRSGSAGRRQAGHATQQPDACRGGPGGRTGPRPWPSPSPARRTSLPPGHSGRRRCPRLWVIRMAPRFDCTTRSSNSSRIWAWIVTSRAVVGSSAIRSRGWQAIGQGDYHPLALPAAQAVGVLVHPRRRVGDAHRAAAVDGTRPAWCLLSPRWSDSTSWKWSRQ